MRRQGVLIAAMLGLVSACVPQNQSVSQVNKAASNHQSPATETAADGSCFAREITPAEYDHVMGQVQVVQAELAPDGTILRAPIYRNAPVPRLVKPQAEVTFPAPCPDQVTPQFIASLQRALFARGYYKGRINGKLDAPTSAAVEHYQQQFGLDSAQLSLRTARELGIIAIDLGQG